MFGSFLSLTGMPPAHQMSAALKQVRKEAASIKHAGAGVELSGDDLIPVLHMLLPDATLPAVSMLALLV